MSDNGQPQEDYDRDREGYDDDGDDAPVRPEGVRFGEGQVANKRGRRRAAKTDRKASVTRVARKRCQVTIAGRSQRMAYLPVALHRLASMAASGDRRGLQLHELMIQKLSPDPVTGPWGVLIAPEEAADVDDWAERVQPEAKIRRARAFMALMGEALRESLGDEAYAELQERIAGEEAANLKRARLTALPEHEDP